MEFISYICKVRLMIMKKILFIISALVIVLCMGPAIKFFWRVVLLGIENPIEVISVCGIVMILLIWSEYKEKINTAIEKML